MKQSSHCGISLSMPRAERLEELLEQIKRIEGKIETLGSSTHPLAVEATALYPQIDELRSWLPLFPGKHPKGDHACPCRMWRRKHQNIMEMAPYVCCPHRTHTPECLERCGKTFTVSGP